MARHSQIANRFEPDRGQHYQQSGSVEYHFMTTDSDRNTPAQKRYRPFEMVVVIGIADQNHGYVSHRWSLHFQRDES
jgi:hypothetical protein